jgi:anti-sigma regulatory factor (Ser/Thr protein kinase)
MLPATLESVRRARVALEHLDRLVGESVLEDVRLLVSEVVTNSLRHSGMGPDDHVAMRVEASAEVLRVEVADPGPGFPTHAPIKPGPERTGGRGLWLVDLIASRWGVRRGDGTCVWFEIDLRGPRGRPLL